MFILFYIFLETKPVDMKFDTLAIFFTLAKIQDCFMREKYLRDNMFQFPLSVTYLWRVRDKYRELWTESTMCVTCGKLFSKKPFRRGEFCCRRSLLARGGEKRRRALSCSSSDNTLWFLLRDSSLLRNLIILFILLLF